MSKTKTVDELSDDLAKITAIVVTLKSLTIEERREFMTLICDFGVDNHKAGMKHLMNELKEQINE